MWIQRQGAHPGRAPAKKPRAGRPGAATVEFAVVAPVFFLLALGIIDVGRGLMVQHLMQNAARQGCRAGILPSNGNAEITAAVTGALQPAGISSESITVTVGVKDAKYASTGDDITVAVSVPVASVSWLPGTSYVKGNITAQYTMRK